MSVPHALLRYLDDINLLNRFGTNQSKFLTVPLHCYICTNHLYVYEHIPYKSQAKIVSSSLSKHYLMIQNRQSTSKLKVVVEVCKLARKKMSPIHLLMFFSGFDPALLCMFSCFEWERQIDAVPFEMVEHQESNYVSCFQPGAHRQRSLKCYCPMLAKNRDAVSDA